jgi:two-component system alkaline phosphatase synthesis response regulator PhoP
LQDLSAGADDYISKPVKPKVLISRIAAMLRRIRNVEPRLPEIHRDLIEYEDITIDRERFMVIHKGRELMLPKKEFELLSLLVSRPDKVFTREDIFGRVWESNAIVGERTIDVHIRKLREKLGDGYISTVKGVGYKFSR